MNNERSNIELNFSVGRYNVIPSRNLIIHDGQETLITPKMLAVLIELAKHQSETLSKQQLILAVWGTLHTSDMVLSRAISDLRKVFSDSARQQHTIETVSKQGYRLKQTVLWQQNNSPVIDEVLLAQVEPVYHQSSKLLSPKLPAKTLALEPSISADVKNIDPSRKAHKSLYLMVPVVISAALLVLLFVTKSLQNVSSKEIIHYKHNNLTLNDDRELNLRFSPDGKYVAYASHSPDGSGKKIHLQSVTDKSIVIIDSQSKTSKDAYDLSPVFSPDGNKVAYKHFSQDSACSINIFSIRDAKIQTLAECPLSKTHALDWSPDGQYLVATMFNYIKKIESLLLVNLLTGKNKTLLAPSQSATGYLWPRFSPDGNSIAVVYFQPNNHLWTIGLVDIKSGAFSEVFLSGEEVSQVVWNETGDALYYLIVRSKDSGIWQVKLDTKKTSFLAAINSSSLDYDKKDHKFAYVEREAQLNIWRSSSNDAGELKSTSLFKNLQQTNYPSLSPDNKHLAFIATESGIDSLWIRAIDSQTNSLLLQAKQNDKLTEPTWSPDGKQLLVSVLNKDSSQIMQFDLELGNAFKFETTNNVKMGKWSKDGRFIYWYEKIDDIWHVMEKNLSTAQKKSILTQSISRFEIIDGKNIYYQKIGTMNVHSQRLSSSIAMSKNDKVQLLLSEIYSWDVHLDAIYYTTKSADKKTKVLFKKDLSSGVIAELYPLAVMPTDAGRNLSVSDNGRTTYYTKLDKYRTDVVLMTKQ
ncbi:MAG: PD40 domain-containing protein [Colwellia sp.]|nr:PD40 domain-containing protein [Colwellia sp.]